MDRIKIQQSIYEKFNISYPPTPETEDLLVRSCLSRTYVMYCFFAIIMCVIFVQSLLYTGLYAGYYILHIMAILASVFFIWMLNPFSRHEHTHNFLFSGILIFELILSGYAMLDLTHAPDSPENFVYLMFCLCSFTVLGQIPRIFFFLLPTAGITLYKYLLFQDIDLFFSFIGLAAYCVSTLFYLVHLRDTQRSIQLQKEALRLEAVVGRDFLTGLYNRQYLTHYLEEYQQLNDSDALHGYLYFCDIDFFKSYNDTHGHVRGDQLLVRVSGLLEEFARKYGGECFRMGGEEFLILMLDQERLTPMDSPAYAYREDCKRFYSLLGEELVTSIEAQKIPTANTSVSPYLTISAGGSEFVYRDHAQFMKYLENSDHALYHAKTTNRNYFAHFDM